MNLNNLGMGQQLLKLMQRSTNVKRWTVLNQENMQKVEKSSNKTGNNERRPNQEG